MSPNERVKARFFEERGVELLSMKDSIVHKDDYR
jgi:hypothetical protein